MFQGLWDHGAGFGKRTKYRGATDFYAVKFLLFPTPAEQQHTMVGKSCQPFQEVCELFERWVHASHIIPFEGIVHANVNVLAFLPNMSNLFQQLVVFRLQWVQVDRWVF